MTTIGFYKSYQTSGIPALNGLAHNASQQVWKFNARNAHGVEGCIKANIVMEILKIGGQLI